MNDKYNKIYEPIKIGKTEIKNRFVMSPMAFAQIDENWAYKEESIDYFVERAKGGTGLIITGANFVENKIEKHLNCAFPCPTENPLSYLKSLKKMTDKIHAYNSKLFVQLTAGLGRSAIPEMILDNTYVAPSETTNRWNPSIKHRALKTEEVYEIIKKFAESAYIAKMGGADGVEVHAVHEGDLLDNFTMELFNQREDEFNAKDTMSKLRFPIAILKAIKQACGEDFPVSLRFSLKSFIKEERKGILPGEENDYKELGRDIEEGLQFAKILESVGYDALNVDAGSYDSWYWAHPPFFFERGLYLEFAKQIKEVVNIPVITAGRLGYPDILSEAINNNLTDMVSLGRPLLADADFVNKLRLGEEKDIRPCLSCHEGCFGRTHQLRLQSCVVNPECNREKEAKFEKSQISKKAIVIGGGPAGMEAARILALRGHDVELLEKENRLGGLYHYAVIPDFKDDGKLLIKWYENQLKKLKVNIKLGYEVKDDDEKLKDADIIICATGSNEFIPNIEGVENSVTAIDVFDKKVEVSDDVTIIGGGLVGCELAIHLSKQGKKTCIIEMADKIMAVAAPPDMNKQMIHELLEHYKCDIKVSSKLTKINKDSIIIKCDNKEEKISTKQVVLALGYRSNDNLYKKIQSKYPQVYNIGDSKKPKDIMEGIWDAYELCSHL